jgi:hypothetical protein
VYHITPIVTDSSKCGLSNLPRRLCGEHRKSAKEDEWNGVQQLDKAAPLS